MDHSKALVWAAVWLLAGLVTGCGGLQETWEGPGASGFRPASIVVLPPIIGALEGSREKIGRAHV